MNIPTSFPPENYNPHMGMYVTNSTPFTTNLASQYSTHTGINDPAQAKQNTIETQQIPSYNSVSPYGTVDFSHYPSPKNQPTSSNVPSTQWKISIDDMTKYLGVFKMIDKDLDGLVGEEAVSTLEKSKVPVNELAAIWDLTSRTVDGYLTASEFIVAMHFIEACRLGIPLPPTLPPSYNEFLSISLEEAFSALDLPPPSAIPAAEATTPKKKMISSKFSSPERNRFTRDTQDSENALRNKIMRDKEVLYSGAKLEDSENKNGGAQYGEEKSSADSILLSHKKKNQDLDSLLYKKSPQNSKIPPEEYALNNVNLLEGIIEADRMLSKKFRGEAKNLDENNENLIRIIDTLKNEILDEKRDMERLLERKKNLERDHQDLKIMYQDLKEEKNILQLKKLSNNKDVQFLQDEILFFKQLLSDIKEEIIKLHQVNNTNESLYNSTDKNIQALAHSRKQLQENIKQEESQLKTDMVTLNSLKLSIEKLKREKDNMLSKQLIAQEKNRQAANDLNTISVAILHDNNKLNAVKSERLQIAEEMNRVLQEKEQIIKTCTNNTFHQNLKVAMDTCLQNYQLAPGPKLLGEGGGAPLSSNGRDAKGVYDTAPISMSNVRRNEKKNNNEYGWTVFENE